MDQNVPAAFVPSLKQIHKQELNLFWKIFVYDYFVIRIAALGIVPFITRFIYIFSFLDF